MSWYSAFLPNISALSELKKFKSKNAEKFMAELRKDVEDLRKMRKPCVRESWKPPAWDPPLDGFYGLSEQGKPCPSSPSGKLLYLAYMIIAASFGTPAALVKSSHLKWCNITSLRKSSLYVTSRTGRDYRSSNSIPSKGAGSVTSSYTSGRYWKDLYPTYLIPCPRLLYPCQR